MVCCMATIPEARQQLPQGSIYGEAHVALHVDVGVHDLHQTQSSRCVATLSATSQSQSVWLRT